VIKNPASALYGLVLVVPIITAYFTPKSKGGSCKIIKQIKEGICFQSIH
jgi:hypothetical protein